jgi:hypothetical protein
MCDLLQVQATVVREQGLGIRAILPARAPSREAEAKIEQPNYTHLQGFALAAGTEARPHAL